MADLIENPVINSPYHEPSRHFVFADEGITSQIAEGRRPSSYFIPIPPPKKRTPQTALPGTWVGERVRENEGVSGALRGGSRSVDVQAALVPSTEALKNGRRD